MQENYNEPVNATQYLKENYTDEEIYNNDEIFDMVVLNHKYNFNMTMRKSIEYLKMKYTKSYHYVNIFKNDKNNINYERLYDIIYDNINKKYNYEIIYEDPEKMIEILEKNNKK
jgi:hypothetical protein